LGEIWAKVIDSIWANLIGFEQNQNLASPKTYLLRLWGDVLDFILYFQNKTTINKKKKATMYVTSWGSDMPVGVYRTIILPLFWLPIFWGEGAHLLPNLTDIPKVVENLNLVFGTL